MAWIRDPATGRQIEVQRRPILHRAMPRPTNAELDAVQARLDAQGGVSSFVGLYEGDRRLRARAVPGKYGMSWLLDDPEQARFGHKWVTYGPKSRAQKTLGLCERVELAPAVARLDARHVVVIRNGCPWGTDATLKEGT